MSIKIWVAWRVPISRFGEATDIIHQQMSESFYQNFKTLADAFWKENLPLELTNAAMKFEDKLRVAEKNHRYDFVNAYSRGFEFFLEKQFVYIIPYGDWNLKIPDWFKDFHYQNQTDRPEEISSREYRYREKVWKRIYIESLNDRSYVHRVIDPNAGFYITFSPFTRRWVEENSKQNMDKLG